MKSRSNYLALLLALTDNSNASQFVTPFVSVANRPLIHYSLDFLISNSFEELTIVTSKIWDKELHNIVEDYVENKIKVDFISVENGVCSIEGLKKFCEQRKPSNQDLLVLTYNLICQVNFCEMDMLHKINDSTVTMLLSNKLPVSPMPLPKKYKKQEGEIMVFSGGELVHIESDSSMDGKLTLKPTLLKNAFNFEVHTDLTDCHLYLFNNRCLSCLQQTNLVSLQKDFVPWLVNNAFDESVCEAVESKKKFKSNIKDIHGGHRKKRLVCKAYMPKQDVCYFVRDVASFCQANFQISKNSQSKKPALKGLVVCGDSMLGEGLALQGKAVVKASVIGKECLLGSNSNVTTSIVMSKTLIGQNVTLESCIICQSVSIPDGTCLKECLVAPRQVVSAGNYMNKEIVDNSSGSLVFA